MIMTKQGEGSPLKLWCCDWAEPKVGMVANIGVLAMFYFLTCWAFD